MKFWLPTLQVALECLFVLGKFGSMGVPMPKFLQQGRLKHSGDRNDNGLFSTAKMKTWKCTLYKFYLNLIESYLI